MTILVVTLTVLFVASWTFFIAVLREAYRNQRSKEHKISALEIKVDHWREVASSAIGDAELKSTENGKLIRHNTNLHSQLTRRNKRIDQLEQELKKCRTEHANMNRSLTLALNEINPLNRKKGLRV